MVMKIYDMRGSGRFMPDTTITITKYNINNTGSNTEALVTTDWRAHDFTYIRVSVL
jgi:hypothetical protein